MHRLTWITLCALLAGCAQSTPARFTDTPHRSWELAHGGLTDQGSAAARAALARVSLGLTGPPTRISVLRSRDPVAFSFPDGSLYVSEQLAGDLSPDELTAVVAHELGHLLRDHILHPPAALRGDDSADVETAADMLGRQLLIAHGIPPESLATALDRIALASTGTRYHDPIYARALLQRELNK